MLRPLNVPLRRIRVITIHCTVIAAIALILGFAPTRSMAGESSRKWGLRAVLKKQILTLELKGPLDGLVDFNRRPDGSDEKAALERAIGTLKSVNVVFDLPQAAKCELVVKSLTSDVQERRLQEEPGKPPKLQKDGTAGVVHVTYRGVCGAPGAVKGITINLFKLFPAVHSLVFEGDRDGKLVRTEKASVSESVFFAF